MLKVLTVSPGETCETPGITVGEAIELNIPLMGDRYWSEGTSSCPAEEAVTDGYPLSH